MKKVISRLICLFRGHKWETLGTVCEATVLDCIKHIVLKQCTRCGKIKEEVI